VVGATVKVTAADPLPLAFELIEIQSTLGVAVQAQSALDERTSTLPFPPLWGRDAAVLESSKRHSPAACDTCARCPFTMTPPVRDAGSALVDTVNWTAPDP
jgi:hypothetical protein